MNVLFVCGRNKMRSPTSESIFGGYAGVDALSAGTSPDAENPISAELIEWSDLIFAMEAKHRRHLNEKFGPLLRTRRIIVLDIPDKFQFMQPELVQLLKKKVSRFLPKT